MPDALLLHIGTHKTGTRSIQDSLGASGGQLREQGVLYPVAGRLRRRPQHANLAFEALGFGAFDPVQGGARALAKEVWATGPRAVILSSEAFARNPRHAGLAAWALELGGRLGAGEVRAVAYVRPQWDYLASMYAYNVCAGAESADFRDFVEQRLEDPPLDYSSRFAAWERALGERLSVRPYGAGALPGGDVVEDLWGSVEWLPDTPIERPRDGNTRPGVRMTEMLRRLTRVLAERGLADPKVMGQVFKQARQTLSEQLGDEPPDRSLTPETAGRIHAHFLASNRAFVARFGGAHDQLLAEPRVAPAEAWTLEDASEAERAIFDHLVEQAVATAGKVPLRLERGRPVHMPLRLAKD